MIELVYILTALQIYCKDAHYSFKSVNFKPLHEWVDEIGDPISDYLDEIKENYYMFNGLEVPRGTVINAEAVNYVPEELGSNEQILNNLLAVITMAHNKINGLDIKESGLNDLLGRLDSHLMKHIALLNMAIKKEA